MSKIAIVGGRVIDPHNKVDKVTNVYLSDGRIIAIAAEPPVGFKAEKMIEANKCFIAPGMVDLNATLFSGQINSHHYCNQLETALFAGITHLATPAYNPSYCLGATEIEFLTELSSKGHKAKAYFIGALTQDLAGKRLNELMLLHQAGCVGFSNDFHPLSNTLVKKRCYDYAAMLGLKIFVTLEEPYLGQSGCMHEGNTSLKLGLPGIPTLSESIALAQELQLIEATGIEVHISRLSAAKSIEGLKAIASQLSITADVAIHQLFKTDQDVSIDNGLCHVRPPFRTSQDLMALRQALSQKKIQAISSQHITLPSETKFVPFQDSTPGIASWPLLLPLTLKLAQDEGLSLLDAMALVTTEPAKILGIDAGHMNINSSANMIIVDPNINWELSADDLKIFGSNNPFCHETLQGKLRFTIVDEHIISHK